MKLTWQRMMIVTVVVLLYNFETIHADSSPNKNYSKAGIFAGATFFYNTLGADFDGVTWYDEGATTFLLPKVRGGFGWGLSLGYIGTMNIAMGYAFELSFAKSNHTVSWPETESDADYYSLKFDGRLYFQTEKPLQPFVILGLGFPELFLTNGRTTVTMIQFKGVSGRVGGGIAYYLNKKISLNGGVIYNLRQYYSVRISTVRTAATPERSDEKVWGNGITYEIGFRLTF